MSSVAFLNKYKAMPFQYSPRFSDFSKTGRLVSIAHCWTDPDAKWVRELRPSRVNDPLQGSRLQYGGHFAAQMSPCQGPIQSVLYFRGILCSQVSCSVGFVVKYTIIPHTSFHCAHAIMQSILASTVFRGTGYESSIAYTVITAISADNN